MKAIKFFISLCSVISVSIGQVLVTGQDSLSFAYSPGPDYAISADSLYVYNQGEEILIIDKILSINEYYYRLIVIGPDTTFYYPVWVGHEQFYYEVPPGDSSLFIFYDPDLCPICGNQLNSYSYFQDSIYISSNSQNAEITILHSEGVGFVNIDKDPLINESYQLSQNYPNPFNSETAIRLSLMYSTDISLKIYNSMGQEICTLYSGYLGAGSYTFLFDGTNHASGIYFYVMNTDQFKMIKKMAHIK